MMPERTQTTETRFARMLHAARCVVARARTRLRDRRLRRKAAAIDRELERLSHHELHQAQPAA